MGWRLVAILSLLSISLVVWIGFHVDGFAADGHSAAAATGTAGGAAADSGSVALQALRLTLKDREEKLSEREKQLAAREKDLNDKEALVQQQTQRYEATIADLRKQVETMQAEKKAAATRMPASVGRGPSASYPKMYEAMDAKKAAKIIEQLDPAMAGQLLGEMRQERASEILSRMTPDKAKQVTETWIQKKE